CARQLWVRGFDYW
nr:immunoglobulin heavy chain junction region [Mus musculus]